MTSSASSPADLYQGREHLPGWQAANWGSLESQQLRWDVLREVAPADFKGSVLDVGCGHKGFRDWWDGATYTGIDLVDGQDIHDWDTRVDVVVASGVLATSFDPRSMIRKLWEVCETAVAFNTLSSRAERKDEGLFYANPVSMLRFCLRLTPKVVLRHDYMPHDFTVYLYR